MRDCYIRRFCVDIIPGEGGRAPTVSCTDDGAVTTYRARCAVSARKIAHMLRQGLTPPSSLYYRLLSRKFRK
ncbi:MAG: hypothetical protein ABW189_01490 [Rickettsiales bacterium]